MIRDRQYLTLTIQITREKIRMYKDLLKQYEDLEKIALEELKKIDNESIYISDKKV